MILCEADDSPSLVIVGDSSGEIPWWNRLRQIIPVGVFTRYDRGLELCAVTLLGVSLGPEEIHTFVSSGMIGSLATLCLCRKSSFASF